MEPIYVSRLGHHNTFPVNQYGTIIPILDLKRMSKKNDRSSNETENKPSLDRSSNNPNNELAVFFSSAFVFLCVLMCSSKKVGLV